MAKGIIKTAEGKGAPMRIAPDATAEMVGALESGTPLDLVSYGDGWYLVEVDGLRGYVAGSMVQALDGIEGLGKISIKKKVGKNGAKSIAVRTVKQPAKSAVRKVGNPTKKGSSIKSAIKATAKPMGKSVAIKAAAKPMTKDVAKKNLENLIKKAKATGMTEDEIKQMASLNGFGNLTDLNGLKDVFSKVTTAVKNAGSKIVNAGKKVTTAGEQVTNAATAIQQPATTAVAPAPAVEILNPNNNVQNQSTMTDETKSKIKKIAIAGAALVGVATVGVIIYKKKKKQNAASNGKGALNGVKKRRKSKKSKKNTGNKLLKLK